MPYKIDYLDGDVLAWSLTDEGATCERITEFTPSLFLAAPTPNELADIWGFVDRLPKIVHTDIEE